MMDQSLALTMRLSSSVQGTPGSDRERARHDSSSVGSNMAAVVVVGVHS